jgi:hypothetical protein
MLSIYTSAYERAGRLRTDIEIAKHDVRGTGHANCPRGQLNRVLESEQSSQNWVARGRMTVGLIGATNGWGAHREGPRRLRPRLVYRFRPPGGGSVGLRERSPVALHHAGTTDGEWNARMLDGFFSSDFLPIMS